MPWSMQNLPNVAKNKTARQQEVCVLAANKSLARGDSEEDAIFACVAAMKAVEVNKFQHTPIIDPRKAASEAHRDAISKQAVHSQPNALEEASNGVVDLYFKDDLLILELQDGTKLQAQLPSMEEITQYVQIAASGEGSGVQTIVAGSGISVDATDPQNPVVSVSGAAGGQEVFLNEEPVIDYPAISFVSVVIDGQTVYQMKVNV